MKTAAGVDLKPALTFIRPDDGNADDQTVVGVTLPEPVPPGGSDHARHRVHVAAAAGVRADGLQGRLLPRRPVVPEDRRLRAGRHARARGGRLELPPVPRELGVLRRLRHATASTITVPSDVRRRRHRRAHARAHERQRHDDLHVRAGRRARLRLDRRPRLHRRQGDVLGDEGRDAGGVPARSRRCSGGRSTR